MNRLYKIILSTFLVGFAGYAISASYLKTDNISSTSGGPVAFNGGITAPTTQIGDVYTTTASLTASTGTNVATAIAAPTFKVQRVGNQVRMFGQLSITPTTSATATIFTLTLPVTRSASFVGTTGARGSVQLVAGTATGVCNSSNATKLITCKYTSGGIAAESVQVGADYVVTGD